MRIAPEEYPILMANPTFRSRAFTFPALERLMEHFGFGATCFESDPVLALYSTGRYQGLVVDAGYRATAVTSVFSGTEIQRLSNTELHASYIDTLFRESLLRHRENAQFLSQTARSSCPAALEDCLMQLKEQIARVATSGTDISDTGTTKHTQSFTLPDGQEFSIVWDERDASHAFNQYFSPTGYAFHTDSLPDLITKTLEKNDPTFRAELRRSVVLTGGAMATPGMPERLCAELMLTHGTGSVRLFDIKRLSGGAINLAPEPPVDAVWRRSYTESQIRANAIARTAGPLEHAWRAGAAMNLPFERDRFELYACDRHMRPQDMTWLGGSIMASLSEFRNRWITKELYNEVGPDRALLFSS